MSKQLIVAGFHRSGTSMLTQELHNAGLFVGNRLLGPHISNVDGHYEDFDFFHFHEKILASHNTTWQYASKEPLKIDKIYEKEMHAIIQNRNEEHDLWGFKDPRTVLFLEQWQNKLDHPYTIAIYRHYEECVNSLLHRASRQVVENVSSDISFWEDPTLAYKMWLTYNQLIISHIEKYPKTTILISHAEMINGFSLIPTVNEKFGFNLNTSIKSAIKKDLLSTQEHPSYPLDVALKEELECTWEKLQALSIAPAQHTKKASSTKELSNIQTLTNTLMSLNISTEDKSPLAPILKKLSDENIEIENKIPLIQENRTLFTQFNANQVLIEAILKLIEKHYKNVDLYFILLDLYTRKKQYQLAEFYILKVFTVSEKVMPYFYNNLANFYIKTHKLLLAEDAIKKAITHNPNNPSFYITQSTLEEKKYQFDAALKNIDTALSILKDNPNAEVSFLLRKVTLFLNMKEENKATDLLFHLLEKYPKDNRIEKRIKTLKTETENLDRQKEREKALIRIQEDKYYFSKILSLLASIDNDWAKNNLLNRLDGHLSRYKVQNTINNKNQTYKTIILTGIPRSGSTLACNIMNSYENTLALLEPLVVSDFYDCNNNIEACKFIFNFSFEIRKKVIYESKITTKHIHGKIPDSPVENSSTNSLRKNIVSHGDIKIDKKVKKDFTLAIKDNSMFTAILDDLTSFFPCYGIIRNPLSVLLSWATVDLPVNNGHIPAGEYFDDKLKEDLAKTQDVFDRQMIILNWFFDQFDKFLPKENILKYEDTIMENGNNFGNLAYDATKRKTTDPLKSKNSNTVYKEIDIDRIYNKLINSKGIFWKFYSLDDINKVLNDFNHLI